MKDLEKNATLRETEQKIKTDVMALMVEKMYHISNTGSSLQTRFHDVMHDASFCIFIL